MDRKDHDIVRISLDGQPLDAPAGDTVAAALLRNGVTTFTRSIKYHRPRGPFCLSGTCGQCLIRIDGVPSRAACRVPAEEGMICERQNGPLGVEADVFRAADFIFSDGLDHHHLLTGSRVLGRVALEIARRLAGLGELPARAVAPVPAEVRTARVVIIGAGPAGVSVALRAGKGVLLVEREQRPGGSAWLGLNEAFSLDWVAQQARAFSGELMLGAVCVGLYANDTALPGNALVAIRTGHKLVGVVAEKVVVATGGASQPLPFPGGDRPGVYAARGLLGMQAKVGSRLVVIGDGPELVACSAALARRGYEIVRSLGIDKPRRALGNPVRGLDTSDGERIRCDAIAIALPPAPLHDLATSAGARARWVGELHGFPVQVEPDGRTAVPWLYAAGRVAGLDALESGEAAGKAVAQ